MRLVFLIIIYFIFIAVGNTAVFPSINLLVQIKESIVDEIN